MSKLKKMAICPSGIKCAKRECIHYRPHLPRQACTEKCENTGMKCVMMTEKIYWHIMLEGRPLK